MTDLENAERLRTYHNTHKPRNKVVNICTARRNWDGCDYCNVYSGCGLECWKQDGKHNCIKCQERRQEKEQAS